MAESEGMAARPNVQEPCGLDGWRSRERTRVVAAAVRDSTGTTAEDELAVAR